MRKSKYRTRNKRNKMNNMNNTNKRKRKRNKTRKHKGGQAPVHFPAGTQPSEEIMQWATTAGRR